MNSSQGDFFITSCAGCGKKYRLARSHLDKLVKCKLCQAVWKAAPTAAAGAPGDASELTGSDANLSSLTPTAACPSSPNPSASTLNDSAIDDDAAWIGRKLGRFQVVEVLGKGAMGVVFRAHDPDLQRDVALKILARKFIRSQKKTYRLEQFVREARSAARLSHPNSVTVYEIGQDQGWFFIAMELIEGKTILDLVRRKKKRVSFELTCELIAQAADALSAAHRLGIIHRDIKPSNLMITKDGRVKVADFGLAQLEDAQDDFELPTKAVGTPYWMSPEQCRNQTAVPQSDIYALGALLFFTLTGEVPFRGKTKREILAQHLNAPFPDPRQYRRDIPETLVRIMMKATTKNPAERYSDAAEMAIGLRQVANMLHQSQLAERWWGGGGYASTGSTSYPPSPTARRIKNALVLLFLIALVGVAVYFAYTAWVSKSQETPIPTPSPTITVGRPVPVYVIEGRKNYHALGCQLLKGEPRSNLTEYQSDVEAEKLGFAPCRYCEDLLRHQKEQAAANQKPAPRTPPKKKPDPTQPPSPK